MPSSHLEIQNLHLSYAGTPALRDVSLSVAPGTVVSLIGPSGCGKTTLLRVIAGLEHASTGRVMLNGAPIDPIPPHRRNFGMVFQEYALFPHLDVAANIAFGLRMRDLPAADIPVRVRRMLELVGLAGYERRRIHQLSGGERQRVALARCLAPDPRLLMLDEPLAALDRLLRDRLLEELRTIIARVGITTIFVTHDQAEAFAVADTMVLMNAGQIEQQGSPMQLYRNPRNRFVARFLGLNNLLAGRIERRIAPDLLLVDTQLGLLEVRVPAEIPAALNTTVTLVLRPEAALLATTGPNRIEGRILQCTFRGSRTTVTLQHASGMTLEFDLDDAGEAAPGAVLAISLRPDAISMLPDE